MNDAQVLAMLAVQGIRSRPESIDLLVWAKTEGLADVENRVRAWHEAQRPRKRPCDDSAVLGECCGGCDPDLGHCAKHCYQGYKGTYEENHIRFPSGEPRP